MIRPSSTQRDGGGGEKTSLLGYFVSGEWSEIFSSSVEKLAKLTTIQRV